MLFLNYKFVSRKINSLARLLNDNNVLGPFSEGLLKMKSTFPVFAGFDPTSPNIHLGHLFVLGVLNKFKEKGCPIYIIVGDTTAKIGDPSFQTTERSNLTFSDQFQTNLGTTFSKITSSPFDFRIMKNSEWHNTLNFFDFLSNYGKFFKIKELLSKDCMKMRFEKGLNFSELSYQLLQSYDYLHLYRTLGCKLQVGGSDQWGNITTGLRLINSLHGEDTCFGLTTNILTDPLGKKMSKSSNNAIWLTGGERSPLLLFQHMSSGKFSHIFDVLYQSKSLALSGGEFIVRNVFGEEVANICKILSRNSDYDLRGNELESILPESKIIRSGEMPVKIIEMASQLIPNLSKNFLREEIMRGKILIDGKKPESPLLMVSKMVSKKYSFVTHNELLKGVVVCQS